MIRFCVCLLLTGISTAGYAQSEWRVAADSSAAYSTRKNDVKAYEWGLRAAVVNKPEKEADSLWSAVLTLSRRLPDSVGVMTLYQAGQYYFMQNKTGKARSYFDEVIETGEKLRLPNYYLRAYLLIAKVEAINNAPDSIIRPVYRQILSDTNNRFCPPCKLDALLGISELQLTNARPDSAAATAREALVFLQQFPDFRANKYYPMIRMELSRCAYLAGDLTTAIEEIEESYAVAKAFMPNDDYMIVIGFMYTEIMGDVNDEKALEGTRTARRTLLKQPNYVNHPFYLRLLTNEVGMLQTLDRTDAAVSLADSVLQRHSLDELVQLSGFDAFLTRVNRLYVKVRRDADSERIARKAQELLAIEGHSGADPSSLYQILGYYHQSRRNFSEAIRCLQEEARHDVAVAPGATYLNHTVQNRIAICQAEAGQRAESFTSFSQLVQDFDQNARTNLWLMSETERDNYMSTSVIASLHWYLLRRADPQPKELELAYNYQLLQKGVRLKINRTINQFMHTRSRGDSSQNVVRQLIQLRSQLATRTRTRDLASQNRLQQMTDSLERMMGKKAMTDPQSAKPVRWQDVRAKLKPGEAAVEIIWFYKDSRIGLPIDSSAYAALLIRPDWPTPKLVHLPKPDEDDTLDSTHVSENTDTYFRVLHTDSYQRALFEQFWQPIANAIGRVDRIYVALDGSYLRVSLPTIRNPRTGRYLLDEREEIVVVNSTQDILDKPHASSSRVAELVGYPAYFLNNAQGRGKPAISRTHRLVRMRNGLTFEELPYTKIEVEQIGKLLKAYTLQPQVRISAAASEAAFRQFQSPKILHVATHGYLRDTSRNASSQLLTCGLVLAGAADTNLVDKQTDGLLTGYEASLLNLHDTELVVLSACESGVGNYFEGEGTHGLQRAFRLAGAQSVLTSLWKVNDQLTQQLMTDFYRYWLSGLSKPQALRRAQQNLRKANPDPFSWGAFVLLGQ